MKLKPAILALAADSFRRHSTASMVLKVALALTLPTVASDLYWDQNADTAGTGGNGNWDTSAALWRNGSATGALQPWSNGNNAVFGGTAGTVTLNTTGLSTNAVSFITTGYTISGNATNILTLGGTAPTIDVVSAGTATFSTGILAGTAGFTKTGAGSLVIQSTSTVSGAVNVNAGMLSLDTSTGSLASATSVSVGQGATLLLNNPTVGGKNDNRLGDIDVTLNGGTFNFIGVRAASNSNEAIDRLVLGSGASTLSLSGSSGSGTLGRLTLDNTTSGFSRVAGSTLAFVTAASAEVAVTAFTETSGIVGGWFNFDNDDFAALSGTNTGTIVAASGYNTSNGTNSWNTTDNVKFTGGAFQVGTSRAINSLIVSETTVRNNLINVDRSLTINTGGLIMTGASHSINTSGSPGVGTLNAGALGNYELIVNTSGTGFTQTIGVTIADNGGNAVSLTKTGASTLSLTGTNLYTGTTYVNQGTLNLTGTASTNRIAGNITISGGTLGYGNSNNDQIANTSTVTMTSGGFELGARTETIASLAMSGGTLARGGATLTLSGASSITGGTLNFTSSADSRITTGNTLALGGATFNYNSTNPAGTGTVTLGGNVSYAATNTGATTFTNQVAGIGRLELGSGTRTFDIADSSSLASAIPEVSVGWTITGAANLAKSGTGTLALSGNNTYGGATSIDGGLLIVNGSLAAASAVTVNSGGTLGGSGVVNGTVTVKSNGILSPGNSPGILTTGATTLEAGSIFEWDLNANKDTNGFDDDVDATVDNGVRGTDFDAINGSGVLTVDNAVNTGAIFRVVLGSGVNLADAFWSTPYITQTWSNIFNGFSSLNGGFNTSNIEVVGQSISGIGSFSISGTSLTFTAVPEPTSALAGILLGAGLLRRRRSVRG